MIEGGRTPNDIRVGSFHCDVSDLRRRSESHRGRGIRLEKNVTPRQRFGTGGNERKDLSETRRSGSESKQCCGRRVRRNFLRVASYADS